ncbi:MAG: hypothetical protein EHM66_00430 [Deltaproteobacteria bacterium]|nr:MAG: hypothetical protein EHM66_00430 [Deltaproteobacteria bacterium]
MKNLPISKTVSRQKREKRIDFYDENGKPCTLIAEIQYDDECKNGHNTFSITGSLYEKYRMPGESTIHHKDGALLWQSMGGCIHEKIIKRFPELAKYIKWHLTSADGPIHYLANTLYHASNKDYNGKAKGEPCSWDIVLYFGDFPISFDLPEKFIDWLKDQKPETLEIASFTHEKEPKTYGTHYTFKGYGKNWYDCPFRIEKKAQEVLLAIKKYPLRIEKIATDFSEGKERDLPAARHCAVWPDVSDEVLSLPKEELKSLLIARLPALMTEFKKDMEELGFTY